MTEETTTPWDDDDFDAEKAKKLLLNLRGDIEKLKNDKQDLITERDNALTKVTEAKTEFEDLQSKFTQLNTSFEEKNNELSSLTALRTKEGLLHAAGLPADYTKFLVGETEEDWNDSVNGLLELRGKPSEPAQERRPDPAQAAKPTVDPKASLTAQLFGS